MIINHQGQGQGLNQGDPLIENAKRSFNVARNGNKTKS